MEYQEKFMKKALNLAGKAYSTDEVPVGAVIVLNGKVLACGYNQREHKNDATAHAEILAIRAACRKLKDFRLTGADLYVTLEPCAMCMGAILNSRLDNLYFGASATGTLVSAAELALRAGLNHVTNVSGGYLEKECSNLISGYFKSKRK